MKCRALKVEAGRESATANGFEFVHEGANERKEKIEDNRKSNENELDNGDEYGADGSPKNCIPQWWRTSTTVRKAGRPKSTKKLVDEALFSSSILSRPVRYHLLLELLQKGILAFAEAY
ncbi:hypothetical protein L914_15554 [Phytophthora nicotianae]|uniref:Uncharacterized protein n=1 Tax=Phytophthora nicotianae TaxID=4792 RepID=W2MNV6_PHYNI|nr:hypothetical protein L914_15554 [Phytophthora nicotianae]